MVDDLEEPWGLLVSTVTPTEGEEERIPLLGSTFVVGRDKDAELVIPGNKFVSTRHCLLQRDKEGGKWVTDCSTNGTLLNNKRLQKNKKVKLADGDVISMVCRRDMPEYNVAYKFQDLSQTTDSTIQAAEETSQDSTLDLTEEVSGIADDEGEKVSEGVAGKRRVVERDETGCDDAPTTKKLALPSSTDEDSAAVDSSVSEQEAGSPAQLVKTGSMEQSLICQICQEIFHDCISLQPCMHCYCGGCYSEWMKNSDKCPACRCKVKRVNKNYLVNNLVDSFLRANPGRKRSEEDMKELDEKNKITKDMLHPKRTYTMYNSDDDDESDHSDSDSPSPLPPPPHQHTQGLFLTTTSRQRGYFVCRQCPAYMSGPSHPPPPPFTCSSSTNHVLCQCCLQPMPDRRTETSETIPPQQCDLCGGPYCHMYWGCTRPGCTGCLGLFKDMEFSSPALANFVNDNMYESTILKDYLQSQHKIVKDMLAECCLKLDSGQYTCSGQWLNTHQPPVCDEMLYSPSLPPSLPLSDSRISSNTHTCNCCALKYFKELAYKYRTDIPNDDLPASVTNRPNCYWGKNCRTQKHNLDHARRYNHICEQTRTS